MRVVLVLGVVGLIGLFVATTFPQSTDARRQAQAEEFTVEEIDAGLQRVFERKLLYWGQVFLLFGLYGWFVFTGRSRRITDWFNRRTGDRWYLSLFLLAASCQLIEMLLLFPLRILSLENSRAWGMTERSILDWFIDYLKSEALSAGIGVVLLLALYLLIRWAPRIWWLIAGIGAAGAGIGFAYILPIWIEPMFNTFEPLRDTHPKLAKRIQALTNEAGIPVEEVLVVDASRRGKFSNAYFTGFGGTRRIVLYDTLIDSHPPDEVESIVAHEIGHWVHHHIVAGIAMAAVGALFAFWLLSIVLRWAVDKPPFRLHQPGDPAGWPFIVFLTMTAAFAVMPIENGVSRYFERQADHYSLETTQDPEVFIRAEKRLARTNKHNIAPTKWSSWLFGTHPTTIERINAARRWKGQREE